MWLFIMWLLAAAFIWWMLSVHFPPIGIVGTIIVAVLCTAGYFSKESQ